MYSVECGVGCVPKKNDPDADLATVASARVRLSTVKYEQDLS